MTSFALYRLPYASTCTLVEQTEGEPLPLLTCAQLNGRKGFVIAPFLVNAEQPILLIRPDRITTIPAGSCNGLSVASQFSIRYDATDYPLRPNSVSVLGKPSTASSKTATTSFTDNYGKYIIDFANFHSQLCQGTFRKIVLSRQAVERVEQAESPFLLFDRACQLYPRLFIALVYTPQSGLWLTATPEILLDGCADSWRTIALAGTMQLQGDELLGEGETARWSTKNIEEQRIVGTYIVECLEHFAHDIGEEGPRTVRAANLVHLRSDFTFTLDPSRVGDLLQVLHPTPAVCGLPKREALRFIVQNESSPRRYYSGFMGPMALSDESTHLYVSLRCMQICGNEYHLYAGGGLLKDSRLEQEWQETEAKLETMRRCIATRRT